MGNKVLVAYASKYGATAEIAARIGLGLQQTGLEVDVLPVRSVRGLSLYKAIVLGSGVYIGQWRKEAVDLLKANERLLAERPVWLFSSGPTGKGNPLDLTKGWKFPGNLKATVERVKPRDTALFGGKIDPNKLSFFERFIIRRVKAEVGDFRDWEAVSSWASTIGTALKD